VRAPLPAFSAEFGSLGDSAGLPPALLVLLLRHVLILLILTRVGRDGLLGNFLPEMSLQDLFLGL
jgi:hypothetical protein